MMNYLTKQQALQAMRDGKKVSHKSFGSTEWMKSGGRGIIFEDGTTCTITEFFTYRIGSNWKNYYFIIENHEKS